MTPTLPSHSEAKHFLLDRYLKAWFPIVSSLPSERIVYLDGFAGEGRYYDKPGSPLIALYALIQHSWYPKMKHKQFTFWFVEKSRATHKALSQRLAQMNLPEHITVRVERTRFKDAVDQAFAELTAANAQLAPTFAFVDPFGFSHTPLATIKQFAAYPQTEVLITFIFEHLNRFLCKDNARLRAHYTELFGTDQWQRACAMKGEPRRRYLHDLYERQLKSAGFQYVISFAMLDTKNHIEYYLIFCTNHVLGLERMKEAMWKVDPSGRFQFSDRAAAAGQLALFTSMPDLGPFKVKIRKAFGGKTLDVNELLQFAAEDPLYLQKHMRAVLCELEDQGKLTVVRAKANRRKHTFPDGTVVRIDR